MAGFNGDKRRQELVKLLTASDVPLSATTLASHFGVSRQIIVGDVSLLRAGGLEIMSTPRGYLMAEDGGGVIRTVVCLHAGEDMEDELNIMVDNGCTVLDVIVDHPVYGQITGKLRLANRYDVGQFVEDIAKKSAPPLSSLTGGVHIHTLRCPDEKAYERVRDALDKAGYLYREGE